MDVEKWKSIVVPMDIYRGIKQIAQMENRSISGSCALCSTCSAAQRATK